MLGRILEEQQSVMEGDEDTPLTWEHLGEMELLHNCMRETLRMYPPLVCASSVFIAHPYVLTFIGSSRYVCGLFYFYFLSYC